MVSSTQISSNRNSEIYYVIIYSDFMLFAIFKNLFLFLPDIFVMLEKQNLMAERHQLNISLTQLEIRLVTVSQERDEMKTRYDTLSKDYSNLQARPCIPPPVFPELRYR